MMQYHRTYRLTQAHEHFLLVTDTPHHRCGLRLYIVQINIFKTTESSWWWKGRIIEKRRPLYNLMEVSH